MRKLINFIVAVFSIATLMFTTVYAEISIPKATSEFYVNDFSDILSESEEVQMIEKAKSLSDEHGGVQVVVTTIKSLEGNSIEDYSYEMYNQYGIGKDDMGLLILLATEDRQIRIEVGKSMEAYFNDSKAGRFIDNYAIPYLKENRFNEGLISLQEQCIKEIVLQIEKESNATETSEPVDGSTVAIILIVLVCLVGFGIFVYNRVVAEGEKREVEERQRREEEERQARERRRREEEEQRERERRRREEDERRRREEAERRRREDDERRRMSSSSSSHSSSSGFGGRSGGGGATRGF